MHKISLLLALIVLSGLGIWIQAQDASTDPAQIYRQIRIGSNDNAADVRWIEIWERRNGTDREWVMIDAESGAEGVQSTCYYALAIGGSTPLYLVDDELRPAPDAQRLFDEIENRNLVDNAQNYVSNLECEISDQDTVNGVEAELCRIEQDALGLFFVRPPATAEGELWQSVDEGALIRYDFRAEGQRETVSHRYERLPVPDDFRIEPQRVDNMVCFAEPFPVPPETDLLTGGLTFSAYASSLRSDELQTFYDLELAPDWESIDAAPGGGRVYRRTLENGTRCTLSLRFGSGQGDQTTIAASVYPESVPVESLELTEDFASPVVVQNVYSLPRLSYPGTVRNVVSEVTADYEAQGWTLRDDLTDIREDSAFIVLAQDEQETYITVNELNTDSASVLIQTRSGTCGPTFPVPGRQ